MCDPVTAAASGLQAMSSISAINDQNGAAVKNSALTKTAMNDEYAQTTESYIEQNRSLVQGGFDAILEGRANEATAYTSAVQNGVQGASVKGLLRDVRQKVARGSGRTTQEQKSLKTQTANSYKGIRAQAQSRINSVPTTKFGLGDAASILAPVVKKYQD